MTTTLTQSRLRCVLAYDPETGSFTWVSPPKYKPFLKGKPAGVLNARLGCVYIGIDGKRYRAHRLAWLYVHGRWPTAEIDHIDRNAANNKLANLREASSSENKANTKINVRNTLGFKGVVRHKNGFRARIKCSGKIYDLGVHSTPERAHSAYVFAAKYLFGEYAHTGGVN